MTLVDFCFHILQELKICMLHILDFFARWFLFYKWKAEQEIRRQRRKGHCLLLPRLYLTLFFTIWESESKRVLLLLQAWATTVATVTTSDLNACMLWFGTWQQMYWAILGPWTLKALKCQTTDILAATVQTLI